MIKCTMCLWEGAEAGHKTIKGICLYQIPCCPSCKSEKLDYTNDSFEEIVKNIF